jgi:hypothetical protein
MDLLLLNSGLDMCEKVENQEIQLFSVQNGCVFRVSFFLDMTTFRPTPHFRPVTRTRTAPLLFLGCCSLTSLRSLPPCLFSQHVMLATYSEDALGREPVPEDIDTRQEVLRRRRHHHHRRHRRHRHHRRHHHGEHSDSMLIDNTEHKHAQLGEKQTETEAERETGTHPATATEAERKAERDVGLLEMLKEVGIVVGEEKPNRTYPSRGLGHLLPLSTAQLHRSSAAQPHTQRAPASGRPRSRNSILLATHSEDNLTGSCGAENATSSVLVDEERGTVFGSDRESPLVRSASLPECSPSHSPLIPTYQWAQEPQHDGHVTGAVAADEPTADVVAVGWSQRTELVRETSRLFRGLDSEVIECVLDAWFCRTENRFDVNAVFAWLLDHGKVGGRLLGGNVEHWVWRCVEVCM